MLNEENHLARESDTEIIMHLLSEQLSQKPKKSFVEIMQHLATKLDGAYSIAYLNAHGDMVIARDPLGIKPHVLRLFRFAICRRQ